MNAIHARKKSPVKRRIGLVVIILLVVCLLLVLIPDLWVLLSTRKQIVSADAVNGSVRDCAVVFGAGVKKDGRLSDMLEDRVKTGIALYKAGKVKKLLFTGDYRGPEYDEPGKMKEYAVKEGVDEKDIFLDHAGYCTYDSVARAKAVYGAQSVVLVTQKYHLYRSLMLANSLKLDAVGVSANLRPYRVDLMISYRLREVAARDKDAVLTLFGRQKKFSDKVIPISGDGRATELASQP